MSALLAGQTALVTGATRGLGRELALALAQAGANVAIVGRDAGNGEITAAQVREAGCEALVLAVDVGDETAMEQAAQAAMAHFGRIDILVCTAGVSGPGVPVWESTKADLDACLAVNVTGVLLAMRAVMPHMIAAGSGRVVVIGGTYGHKGVANAAIYSASKWALRGLVKSAALESARHGITCNVVSPAASRASGCAASSRRERQRAAKASMRQSAASQHRPRSAGLSLARTLRLRSSIWPRPAARRSPGRIWSSIPVRLSKWASRRV